MTLTPVSAWSDTINKTKAETQSETTLRPVAPPGPAYLCRLYYTVMVAVTFVLVMKVTVYQIISVIAMRNGFVTTVVPMYVTVIMPRAIVA